MKQSYIGVILVVFVVLSAGFYVLKGAAPAYSFPLLMAGNVIMALLTLIGHVLVQQQIAGRPQAFVRGVYSATFLKLLVCIGAILVYVMVNRPNVHKPSLFVLFGIYAVYTTVETLMLSKMAKGTK